MITVREFFELHSLLTAVVEKELGTPALVPQAVKELLAGGSTDRSIPDPVLSWLGLLDLAVNPHLLRTYVKEKGADEETLRAFLRFLVGKTNHSQADRDKVDWLATYFFQAREEKTKQPTGWPKNEVQRILQGFSFGDLNGDAENLLTEISSLLEEIKYFEKFSQVTDSRIIQRGRELKNRFAEDFYHPDVLAAVINYNLVFGKKFHALLHQTMQSVHDFAGHHTESGTADTQELLRNDYRSTSDAFRDLGEAGRAESSTSAGKAVTPASTPASYRPAVPERTAQPAERQDKLRELGINIEMEALNVRKRMEEIAVRLKANPTMNSLRSASVFLPLMDWESNAFRTNYPESEQSFRADFAHGLCHGIALLSLIYDELAAYDEKKGTEYLWKRHYDTLLYLLQEGRSHKERLQQLSAATERKGLIEKAKQLSQTSEKLEAGLAKVAAIF